MKRILGTVIFAFVALSGCDLLGAGVVPVNPEPGTKQISYETLPKVPGHSDEVLSLFPLEDGFVSIGKDGKVIVWKGKGSPRLLYEHPEVVDRASYNPETGRAGFLVKNIVSIVDTATEQTVARLDRLKSRILDMQFAHDGKALFIGCADSRVYRWKYIDEANAASIQEREKAFERYNGPALPVSHLALHQNGRVFFSSDWAGAINGWMTYDSDRHEGYYDENLFGSRFYAEDGVRVKMAQTLQNPIDLIELTPNNTLLAAALRSGLLELYKVRGIKKAGEAQVHTGDIFSLAASPDSLHVATAGRDGFIRYVRIDRLSDAALKEKKDRRFDYELVIEREIAVPDIQVVAFGGRSSIIAGSKNGSVISISIDQMQPIPVPTPH